MDVVTGAIASQLPRLVQLLDEEYKLPMSVKEDVEYVIREMEKMQAALVKVAEVRREHLDLTVKDWADYVRKLSYEMEIVLDKLLRAPNSEEFRGFMEKMGRLFNKGKAPHQIIITSAIKEIKMEVQIMAERYERYGIYDIAANPAAMMIIDPHLQALYTQVTELVGIDEQKDLELMKLLSEGDNLPNKKLKIVSVVGFGGLGKTTLVAAVYGKIKMGFDCAAFVPAGQNPDFKKVLTDIISGLTRNYLNTLDELDERQLIEKLREILVNKRYLIVIDDIWNENLWENIKYALSNENNLGCQVIITTRIVSVSKACRLSANDSVYQMESLSDDDSKKLFYHRTFGSMNGCPREFEQVSSDILKRCGGIPLAIITVASSLVSRQRIKGIDEWHALLKSIGHGFIEDSCMPEMQKILSLSYYDLPPHLKTCLLYLSAIPGTHTIEKYRLVKKLVAEGIVTQELKLIGSTNIKEASLSQELSLEEATSQYLDELVNRNVIHPLECNKSGEVITYHIHLMMQDVLKAIAIEEKFSALLDDKDISSVHRMNYRHISVDCSDSENLIDLSSMGFDGGVRSLSVFGHANRFLLRNFNKGTRVLDLEGCTSIERADVEYICSMVLLKQLCLAKTDITELPPQIGDLQYLEGLDIGGTQITELPPQIGKLQHLKTLDARKARVKELPDQVVRLIGLVNLLIGDSESCEGVKLPDGIAKMTSLQQLCTIDLRKCSISSLKELSELFNLKEIAIVSGDTWEDTRMNDALLSSLDKSTNLRSVVVYSNFRLSKLQSSSAYKSLICRKKLTVVRTSLKVPIVIAGYRFLSMLDIRVCKLEEDDLKILRELPGLQSLILRLEVLPRTMVYISCEGFSKLESFHVECPMPRMIFLEGAMPKLEDLGLQFYAGSAMEEHIGMKHLLSLQKVILRYSKWCATNKGVRETTDAVKTEADEHQNEITLCITEENEDGTCTMSTEILQENRVASSSKMTEIVKEEEDTQEGGLHQSSPAIASCSGTSEIEEVVE